VVGVDEEERLTGCWLCLVLFWLVCSAGWALARCEFCVFLLRRMAEKIQIKTTPRDPRFPNTNQATACYTRYNEYLLCLKRTARDEDACKQARQYAVSICPTDKLETWDEEVENKTFPGISLDDDDE